MPFVQAKCTNCGANLKVESTQDAANCEHCGAAFIVEKAINNYNIENAQINTQTVNINIQYNPSDFVIEGGVLKKYRGNSKEIVIPDTVIEIQGRAFYDCKTVTKITIPSSVKRIEYALFSGCDNLRSVEFLGAVECGIDIFQGCSLTKIKTSGNIKVIFNDSIQDSIGYVFPKDLFVDNKHWANRWIIFLRGYVLDSNALGHVKFVASRRYENSYDKSPLYVNGDNVIEKLVNTAESGGGCYIATAVYGDYDAPQVIVLRRYRDNKLAKTVAGRLFIKIYYHLSPPLARRLKNMRFFNMVVRRILDRFVERLS